MTQQAVGEGDDFLRALPPTPAPLIHQPGRIDGVHSKPPPLFCSRADDGLRVYSQEEGEQQGERREKAEADGGAQFVCVLGHTGGDGVGVEFHQTGENCGGIFSDQCSTIHVGRVCMALYWEQPVCKLVKGSGGDALGRSSPVTSVWRPVWTGFIG